jgi:hypothetical protein
MAQQTCKENKNTFSDHLNSSSMLQLVVKRQLGYLFHLPFHANLVGVKREEISVCKPARLWTAKYILLYKHSIVVVTDKQRKISKTIIESIVVVTWDQKCISELYMDTEIHNIIPCRKWPCLALTDRLIILHIMFVVKGICRVTVFMQKLCYIEISIFHFLHLDQLNLIKSKLW